jgi:hypothetical protein
MDTPVDAPIPTVVLIVVLAAAGFIAFREVCNALTEQVALHTVASRILWAGCGVLAMTTVACTHSEREIVVEYAYVAWSLTAVTLLCMCTTVVTMILNTTERQYIWTQARYMSRTMYLRSLSPLLTVGWWLIMLPGAIIAYHGTLKAPAETAGHTRAVNLWWATQILGSVATFVGCLAYGQDRQDYEGMDTSTPSMYNRAATTDTVARSLIAVFALLCVAH